MKFIIIYTLMVLSLFFVFSYISGWQRLAQHYRTSQPPPHDFLRGQSGRMGWVTFRGVLNVGTGADGLYLSMFPLFRLFHPPLLIPWTAVTKVELVKFLFWKGYRLHIGQPRITTLFLYKAVFQNACSLLYCGKDPEYPW
ncbi:MAG: hypothetical protein AB1589_17715 [Cyanobacteriota bacterium]